MEPRFPSKSSRESFRKSTGGVRGGVICCVGWILRRGWTYLREAWAEEAREGGTIDTGAMSASKKLPGVDSA
jgi:hypothetical protein